MKDMIKRCKHLLLISLLILLCIFTFTCKEIFLGREKNEKAISTVKPNLKDEVMELSLDIYESIGKVGEAKELVVTARLKSGISYLENVVFVMELSRNGATVSKEDVILMYNDEKILSYDGKYKFAREEFVERNTTYNLKLIYNNEGIYDVKIYAEAY